MKARTIGIVAAAGLATLVGCAARETNAEEPSDNAYTIISVDEQTGTRTEMSFETLSIERGNMSFHNDGGLSGDTISYLNSAGERVEISAYSPRNYESLPNCDMYIFVNGIYTDAYGNDDEALCNAAGQKWMEVCKELRCLETIQEWQDYTDNLRNTITPERLQ